MDQHDIIKLFFEVWRKVGNATLIVQDHRMEFQDGGAVTVEDAHVIYEDILGEKHTLNEMSVEDATAFLVQKETAKKKEAQE